MSTTEVKEETDIVPTMIQAASQAKIEVSRKATAENDAGPRSARTARQLIQGIDAIHIFAKRGSENLPEQPGCAL